jgi:HlyD family secretion protein
MSDPIDLDELELEALENRNRDRRKLESDIALPSRQAKRSWPVRLKPLSGWQGIALGLALGGIFSTAIAKITSAPKPPAQTAAKPAPPSQSVSLETVKMAAIAQTVPTQGTVDAREWAAILPQATGLQIKQILVQEGQQVTAGQAIAELDTSTLQDQISEANSQLNAANAQLASAKSQVDSASAQVKSAETQLTSAQADVEQKKALRGQQKALLDQAESNLKRYQALADDKVISKQDLESRSTTVLTAREAVSVADSNINAANAGVGRANAGVSQAEAVKAQAEAGVSQAQAGIQTAQARLQQLETKVAQATVRAPLSGTLTKKNPTNGKEVAQVGELTGSAPLFYLLQGGLDLQLKVPESLLSQIRIGATAQITSDADPALKLEGNVREIAPVVNEQKQAIVKVSLPNSGKLRPGMFLKASIATTSSQSLTIPDKALKLQGDGSKIVFVLDDQDIAHAKTVEIGDPRNGRIPVKNGLKEGDRIVAQPGFVNDGDRIQVVK